MSTSNDAAVGNRRPSLMATVKIVLAVVAAVFAGTYLYGQREAFLDAAGRLGVLATIGAAVAVLFGVAATGMSWRALLADLGSPLATTDAARVFFPAQLGKYLPGSAWSLIAQVELARDYEVPRRTSATAALLTVAISMTVGLTLALVLLPLSSWDVVQEDMLVGLAVIPLVIALHPRVLNPSVGRILRFARRQPLPRPLTHRGVLTCAAWAAIAWIALGCHIALLASELGAPADGRTYAISIGGFAIAWSIGFLVILAPAGAGVREAALGVALAPVLPRGEVLVVVLISRVLTTGADLALAGLTIARRRRKPTDPT